MFLSIFLLILKIILYTVLILLGIIIFLILLVLLVPIKYKGYFDSDNLFKGIKDIETDFTVTWLLKIFIFKFYMIDSKQEYELLFFGKYIFGSRKKKAKPKKRSKKEVDLKETTIHIASDSLELEEKLPETKSIEGQENIKIESKERDKKKNKKEKKVKEKQENKESIFDKIKKHKKQIDYYYNYPDRDIIIKNAIKLIKNILRSLKPKIFKLIGEIGLDDPSVTGQIIAVSSFISGVLSKKIFLKGNFEQKIANIYLVIQGKIKIGSLVFSFLKFAFTKPVFKIIKSLLFGKKEKVKVQTV